MVILIKQHSTILSLSVKSLFNDWNDLQVPLELKVNKTNLLLSRKDQMEVL